MPCPRRTAVRVSADSGPAGVLATRWAMDRADHDRGRRNLLLKALDAVGMGFDS